MMEINYLAMTIVTLTVYAFSAAWYSPLMFGKTWMKIMGSDNLSKDQIAKLQKEMGKFYLLQLAMTVFTSFVLYMQIHWNGMDKGMSLAFFIWLGFVMPTQVSSVIWGKTEKKWWTKQIFIMISSSLISMLFAGWVFSIY